MNVHKSPNGSEFLVRTDAYSVPKSNYKSFSEFLADKRGYPRKNDDSQEKAKKVDIASDCNPKVPTRELATRVAIDYELFRKIVNMQKATKKRDCIIAICYALCLSVDDTNVALHLYDHQRPLDASNPRDKVIISAIEAQAFDPWTPKTISEINERLATAGFSELDIIEHRVPKKKYTPFEIINERVDTYAQITGGLPGDPYNSLSTAYSMDRYRCCAMMTLVDTHRHVIYELSADTNRSYSVQTYNKHEVTINTYTSPIESGDFKDYFEDLRLKLNRKMKEMRALVNDTKNYRLRVSAGIHNDAFHVYAETYNYRFPEYNEYYLFEYVDGGIKLSVYKQSAFMRCYLTPEQYRKEYGNSSNPAIAQYTSMEKLEAAISESDVENKILVRCRLHYFRELQEQADLLITDILSQRRFIRRLNYFWDDRDRVCAFYGVTEEFNCSVDEDWDYMKAGTNAHEFPTENGSTVNITLDDLYQAFELGFHDIDEICRVKKKYLNRSNVNS